MNKKLPVLILLYNFLVPSSVAQPNIILILADDQGWNGLSAQMDPEYIGSKSDFYHTPYIDWLASEGMRFSHGYAPAPVCSPTRHSIQFGMCPAKIRVTNNNAKNIQLCEPKQALANMIKKADARYTTAHFGKWHVSLSPAACGYDVSDGSLGNSDGNKANNTEDPKRTFEVSKRAVSYMKKKVKANQPFFMQVSYFADHLKFMSSPKMEKKYKLLPPGARHKDPVFAGMNEDLDRGVGQILNAINELGISNNTYIFYMADNGYDESKSKLHGIAKRKAWPLSYSKGFVFEGGIRVPFIVKGPGIKPGTFSNVPVVGYDLMPTFIKLINPKFKLPKIVEGGSMLPVLMNGGEGNINRANEFLVFHYPTGVWPAQTSMIMGDYKMVKTWAFDRLQLFNLKNDISETKDLSQVLREKTKKMHKILVKYLDSINAIQPPLKELEFDRNGLLMKKSTGK